LVGVKEVVKEGEVVVEKGVEVKEEKEVVGLMGEVKVKEEVVEEMVGFCINQGCKCLH
jgi:hypothetical protein